MSLRASKIVVAICGIMGGWLGYWIGQPTISVRYWIAQTTTSTGSPEFAWWSKNVDWPAEVQSRLAYLADEQLFPFWRFLLSIGLAVLFVCVAALVVTRLPAWRVRKVLQNGTSAEATVVRVEKTGEQVRGPAGVERQLAIELDVRREGRSPYRARRPSFSTGLRGLPCNRGRGSSCVTTRPSPSEWPS
jgi:hypothetical protein